MILPSGAEREEKEKGKEKGNSSLLAMGKKKA